MELNSLFATAMLKTGTLRQTTAFSFAKVYGSISPKTLAPAYIILIIRLFDIGGLG